MDLTPWLSLCCILSLVLGEVSLIPPSGNVLVCPGEQGSIQCMTTERPIFWINGPLSRLINSVQPPEELGNLTLAVISVMLDGSNLRVTSNATISYSQLSGSSLLVVCSEATTSNSESATFIPAGVPLAPAVNLITLLATQSSTNSSSLLISWSMSDCAVQYVVTIINSSDDSVYPNITTSDTNTTVTLPTGVEFCVTVLGVDSINRTGPASEPQCYTPIVNPTTTSSPGGNTATTPSSPTVPVDQSSGVSGGAIAGTVVASIVIILAVLAAVAVIVFVIYRKGYCKKSKSNKEPIVVGYSTYNKYQCVCHTFCQDVGLNRWKVKFVFVPTTADLEILKMFYKDFKVYGSPFDCHLKSSDTIQVKALNDSDKWTVHTSDEQVKSADVEEYTSEGSLPSTLEMIITAALQNTTPPDLTVEAKLEGVNEPNIIKFEKEAQNVVECVCQVFYHKIALNHWRAKFTFFPKHFEKNVNQFYPNANNPTTPFTVTFGGGTIGVSLGEIGMQGWEVTVEKDNVPTADIEGYTGEVEPPYCEMTLKATDRDKSALTILQPVTLIGVRHPNNIFQIERELVDTDGTPLYAPRPSVAFKDGDQVYCQVFYHKLEEINHWKATLALFPKDKHERVKKIYQDANYGPIMNVKLPNIHATRFKIVQSVPGWTALFNWKDPEVKKSDIESYTGGYKPPTLELTFTAAPGQDNLRNLQRTIVLYGIKSPNNTLTIERKAIAHSEGKPHKKDDKANTQTGVESQEQQQEQPPPIDEDDDIGIMVKSNKCGENKDLSQDSGRKNRIATKK